MTSKKLTIEQAAVRMSLLHRLAQRTESSARCEPVRPMDLGRIGNMHVVPASAAMPMAVFRGKVKAVTPEEKKRFHTAARSPKNKNRKDYPLVVVL